MYLGEVEIRHSADRLESFQVPGVALDRHVLRPQAGEFRRGDPRWVADHEERSLRPPLDDLPDVGAEDVRVQDRNVSLGGGEVRGSSDESVPLNLDPDDLLRRVAVFREGMDERAVAARRFEDARPLSSQWVRAWPEYPGRARWESGSLRIPPEKVRRRAGPPGTSPRRRSIATPCGFPGPAPPRSRSGRGRSGGRLDGGEAGLHIEPSHSNNPRFLRWETPPLLRVRHSRVQPDSPVTGGDGPLPRGSAQAPTLARTPARSSSRSAACSSGSSVPPGTRVQGGLRTRGTGSRPARRRRRAPGRPPRGSRRRNLASRNGRRTCSRTGRARRCTACIGTSPRPGGVRTLPRTAVPSPSAR